MKNSFWYVIGLAGLLALGSLAEATEWLQYDTSSRRTLFYDASSIRRPSKDLVTVWKKNEWSQEGVDQQIALRRKHGLSTTGYENFRYSMELHQINCSTRKYQINKVAYYGNDDKILDTYDFERGWEIIPPDSAEEDLYNRVCKQKGKQ